MTREHGQFLLSSLRAARVESRGLTGLSNDPFGSAPSVVTMAHLDLIETISMRRLTPAFQPIVDLAKTRVAGLEALARPTPTPSFQTPAELFDRAQELGMLWAVEDAMRRATFRAASPWPDDLLLFLNTTPDVLAHQGFADALLDAASSIGGLAAENIVIEITERSADAQFSAMNRSIERLRSEGVQIALDDVGAGSNGLNRITQLRPAWLKLDRGLISGIDQDPIRRELVRSLVDFASRSDVRVIGEGVERRAELSTLVELGVGYAQGFLIGCPASKRAASDGAVVTRTLSALARS